MRTFCTIITSHYFPYAVTLYRSLIKFHEDEKLFVFVCDEGKLSPELVLFKGITIFTLQDITLYEEMGMLYHKYVEQNMDAFRWSMKPVVLRYLLEKGFEKVIYVDCDIFFFGNYDFLFDELNVSNVLLTPSWRTADHKKNEEEFIHLYTDGLYNAGFIAANSKAIPALKWWTQACSYQISIDYEHGLFVDQKYLDAMPVLFENIKVLKHKGCNIALWNQIECKRVHTNTQILINGKEPIIFVHFHSNYIRELLEGNDSLLFPYLECYESIFAEYGFKLNDFIRSLPTRQRHGFIKKFKQKTLMRTRFKNLMQKLVDKI